MVIPMSQSAGPLKIPLLLGVLLACQWITSCAPGYVAPPVTPELVKISKVPVSRIERGYVIHQAKCAKCHPFENPANYSVVELTEDIMPEMGPKSKISDAESADVLAYLLAARQLPPPPAR